jgi:hypothetical protein
MLPIMFRFIWQSSFRGEVFRNRPIRNKNCLWWPCLLMDGDKMSKLDRAPSIDDSYQVSVHLAKGFKRRRLKCEKLTDDRRWMPSDGKSSHCLWQDELKMTYVPLKYSLIKIRSYNTNPPPQHTHLIEPRKPLLRFDQRRFHWLAMGS